MPLSAAERQRRCREKRNKDPEKVAQVKKKDLERYHARKRLVKDMTPREHKQIKRKWQIKNKKRRERQKALQNILINTPASTPSPSSSRSGSLTPALSSASARGRKQVRRDRSKLYRQNVQLQDQLQELRKKLEKYKKRLHRKKDKDKKEKSSKKSEKENEDKITHTNNTTRKYAILSNAIKKHYKKIKDHKTKRRIKAMFQDTSIDQSGLKLELLKESLGINRATIYRAVPLKETILKRKIHNFYLRDDVSRATAGKKDTKTYKKVKTQKRFLLDTMKNLHLSFLKENPDVKCHYSYFAKYRPFYVVPPSIDSRETCMCKLHANIAYMAVTLHKNKVIKSNDMNHIILQTVCDIHSFACMKGKCGECESKRLDYNEVDKEKPVELAQWVRTTEIIEKDGKKVKISKNVKNTETVTIRDLIKKFEEELKVFKSHVFNIKNQYKSYRQCVDNLTETEIALHVDFSENYACKYSEEIQSVHFGGSRNQVSLHTAVMYHLTSEKEKEITSFCTVSSDLNHGPAAIWAHLHPILDYVQKELPYVKTIHIFSDGPATQYKQKNNFYLIATRFFEQYGFESLTWNFFESGHGKGAADGIGGSIKRLADHFVATGHDIADASQFFEALNGRSKTKLFSVSKDDIAVILMTIPNGIIPLKGTMQVHQLFAQHPGSLSYRILSCFCSKFCSCYDVKTYHPLPEDVIEVDSATSDLEEPLPLTDISNMIRGAPKGFYETVYPSSTSEDEDERPLVNFKKSVDITPGTSYELSTNKIHPLLIKNGTHLLVKVPSIKKIDYTYLGVAKSDVDEEGDVRVMFYKTVDDTGKIFKLVETDVSDVMYENLLEIVPTPKKITRGRRVLYQFDQPIKVFEN